MMATTEVTVKEVKLLVVPVGDSQRVFEALNRVGAEGEPDATSFGDNGGDPDGEGPFMQDASMFSQASLDAALAAGARLEDGYEVEYEIDPDAEPLRGVFCGYQANAVAYTLDREMAERIAEYTRRSRRLYERRWALDVPVTLACGCETVWHEGATLQIGVGAYCQEHGDTTIAAIQHDAWK